MRVLKDHVRAALLRNARRVASVGHKLVERAGAEVVARPVRVGVDAAEVGAVGPRVGLVAQESARAAARQRATCMSDEHGDSHRWRKVSPSLELDVIESKAQDS